MNLLGDLGAKSFYAQSIGPAAYGSGSITGAAIDMAAGPTDGLVTLIVSVGATTGTVAVTAQECDTVGGTYTAVTGSAVAIGSSGSNTDGKVSFQRTKRFLQAVTVNGAAATGVSAGFLSGLKSY